MPGADRQRRDVPPVHGLLLLDKPPGLTSNGALQQVKRLLHAGKGGHTGSLDPAATGMLPLCFGEATKVCAYLLDADKTYRVVAQLGQSTDTGDADGQVVATAEVPPLDERDWASIFEQFQGEIRQIPPMYSALKKDGKRLYELARQGQQVERKARRVRIHALELLECRGARLAFRVRCSKGTYVRTLVEDMARAAGTVAHTAALHRESVAGFEDMPMLTMETLQAMDAEALRDSLLPVDRALQHLPACTLAEESARLFADGQPADAAEHLAEAGQHCRTYGSDGHFLGIGRATGDGRVAPRRLFHLPR